jgi:1-deoxy-D-xylulose-5-phosphate synthase
VGVTFEDHVLMGGFGRAVLELFNEKRITTPVFQIGWPDQFIEHASSVEDLRNKYGVTAEAAVARVKAEFGAAKTRARRDDFVAA